VTVQAWRAQMTLGQRRRGGSSICRHTCLTVSALLSKSTENNTMPMMTGPRLSGARRWWPKIALRLLGYEVFRFGGFELLGPDTQTIAAAAITSYLDLKETDSR
jgi:hypothetical protein